MKLHTRYECLDIDGEVVELSKREEKHLLKQTVGDQNRWLVAAAIVASALISAYSQRKSDKARQEGISSAMSAEERIAQRQLNELKRQYDQAREDFAPFRETGLMADEQLRALLSGEEVTTPLTNVLARQGEKSVSRAASAQGFLNTGQQKLALQRAGQEAALQGTVNPLLVLSGRGQAATGSVAGLGSQYSGNVTNVLAGLGTAQSNFALRGGQARASAYEGYGNIANNALNQYMMYRGYQSGGAPASYYGAGQTSGYGSNVPGDAYAPAYGG